ncbi:Kelch-like protein 3 [Araneus ventricosus]|uniref:Kelch-like protein diablo n=1 Tax=Araneus ventricosus TaxID=182803 RepID=A0A4Y2AGF1_ARAVE|nr:Kelch-like protein 3 [Araneus ventricosus]
MTSESKTQQYHHPAHFKDIFKTGEFGRLQKLSDACLHTEDGGVFYVHRMFLAFRNSFFRSLFCRNKHEKHFYIPNIDEKTLDTILIFLYIGNISLTEENAKNLLTASSILKVEDLFKLCHSFALKKMTTKNCLCFFTAALDIKDLQLLESCYRFVQIRFEEVLGDSREGIADLPLDALLRFLGDRNLNVTSENTIWKTIVMWSEMETTERLRFVPRLLSVLNFKGVDEDLATEILSHPIIKYNPFCNELNNSIVREPPISNRVSLLKYIRRSQNFIPDIYNHRIPLTVNFISYYSMSKESPSIKLYLTYDENLDIWRQVGDIDFWPDSLIQIKERIYMFNSLENRSLAFDALSNSLTEISPSPIPRFHYHVVAVGDSIYAVGGATERDETTSLLECYDPFFDTWEIMKPMIPMILWEAIIMDRFIYAIGEDATANLATMMVQVYDPDSSNWSSVSAPKVYRQEFAVATFRGQLYVIGGHSPFNCLKSVETYEPATDTWRDLPDLPFSYVLPKAVVLDSKVLVYEDLFKGKHYGTVHPPVYFDEERQNWVTVEPVSPLTDIHLYQFCSLEGSDILKELVANNRRSGISWINSFLCKSFKSLN